jgi:GxxExxY protein
MVLLYPEVSDTIIGCFYQVYNTLGYGFLERVYENALSIELKRQGLVVSQQMPITVYYETVVVGEYFADKRLVLTGIQSNSTNKNPRSSA